jgi:hypothetical protein
MKTILSLPALLLAALLSGPAAAEDLRPLCSDRPGKGTSPCTLDQGHFQIEIDAFDATFQRSGAAARDTYVIANPTLKYGLSDVIDIEASFAPSMAQRTHDGVSDRTQWGNGDGYLRGKWNFLNRDGSFAAVFEPFVKIASATRGLGNGAMEEGVVVPMSYDLGNGWSLASAPESDLLLNGAGSGRHAALMDVIGLCRTLGNGVTLGAELWTAQDFDPSGTASQYSFDVDAAWQPQDGDIQWDGGLNLGLNRDTPGVEFYFGVSRRL